MKRYPTFIAATAILAACGAAGDPPPDPSSLIACATDGSAEFASDCSVERADSEEGAVLVVRHPDGGFRRFVVKQDRTGLEVADGFFGAENRVAGEFLEVQVEDDRYRFPAALDEIGRAPPED